MSTDLPDEFFHDGPDRDGLADAFQKKPYTVVERTEPCGKDACACTDDPDGEHGPYRYHVYTQDDGSQRWEYQGRVLDV